MQLSISDLAQNMDVDVVVLMSGIWERENTKSVLLRDILGGYISQNLIQM